MIKRIFDLIVSILGLVVTFPIIFIISILIKINGPIIFRQQRIGRNGVLFWLYKFRSMRVDTQAESGRFDAGDASRITTLGKILRRTKLDEIPQLLNVLKGDMSIVGPRPEVYKWTQVYPEKWEVALSVKPGITDNASIAFRNEEKMLASSKNPQETYQNIILPKKLDLYIAYVKNQSILEDIKILIKSIYAILFH